MEVTTRAVLVQTDMSSDNPEVNPYAPPQVSEPQATSSETSDRHPFQDRHRNELFDRILLLAMTIGCCVAVPFVLKRIFNIIPTGCGAVCVGVLMIVREWLCRSRGQAKWPLLYWIGAALNVTTFGFTALINILAWGPETAEAHHVDWAVVGFAVLFALSGLFAFMLMPRTSFNKVQGGS